MDRVARDFVLSVICILAFSSVSFAATPKDCKRLILQTQSWVTDGKPTAVQVAFNESGGDEGQFSLADGHLKFYNPADVPEVEGLLKRGQPGAFQQLSKFAMDGFKFEDASNIHTSERKFATTRIDKIFLVFLGDGEVFVIQGSTVSPVKNLQCFTGQFYDPGYYMTGFMQEGNSTALVSFVVRNVTP